MRQEREAFDAGLLGPKHVAHHRHGKEEGQPPDWTTVLPEGVTCETIVTSQGNHPNAAAIGVRRTGDELSLKLYAPSNTFENLQEGALFGVNVVSADQTDLLARCALKGHGNEVPELLVEELEWKETVPVLFDVSLRMLARVTNRVEVSGNDRYGAFTRARVRAAVLEVEGDPITPITRPGPPIVEGLIAMTRLKVASGEVREELVAQVRHALATTETALQQPHPISYKVGRPDGAMAHLLLKEALERALASPS